MPDIGRDPPPQKNKESPFKIRRMGFAREQVVGFSFSKGGVFR